jgi:hypothetical protein
MMNRMMDRAQRRGRMTEEDPEEAAPSPSTQPASLAGGRSDQLDPMLTQLMSAGLPPPPPGGWGRAPPRTRAGDNAAPGARSEGGAGPGLGASGASGAGQSAAPSPRASSSGGCQAAQPGPPGAAATAAGGRVPTERPSPAPPAPPPAPSHASSPPSAKSLAAQQLAASLQEAVEAIPGALSVEETRTSRAELVRSQQKDSMTQSIRVGFISGKIKPINIVMLVRAAL